jgi:hypothetical protein
MIFHKIFIWKKWKSFLFYLFVIELITFIYGISGSNHGLLAGMLWIDMIVLAIVCIVFWIVILNKYNNVH